MWHPLSFTRIKFCSVHRVIFVCKTFFAEFSTVIHQLIVTQEEFWHQKKQALHERTHLMIFLTTKMCLMIMWLTLNSTQVLITWNSTRKLPMRVTKISSNNVLLSKMFKTRHHSLSPPILDYICRFCQLLSWRPMIHSRTSNHCPFPPPSLFYTIPQKWSYRDILAQQSPSLMVPWGSSTTLSIIPHWTRLHFLPPLTEAFKHIPLSSQWAVSWLAIILLILSRTTKIPSMVNR